MLRLMFKRSFSSQRNPSSAEIRKSFIDYFIENKHSFIKSSSVIPHNDPTVAFVNAGMNQFKNILLGNKQAQFPRAVNSQKCIRVGGKHNDLEAVGQDGTHHTFFEMLGNWSFDDYFKEDACILAWQFLTRSLQPSELVVTYFGGDETQGLPADVECAEIWRKLGLKEEQIIACGMKDNFWEMGPIGPCGTCTEIHLKHEKGMLELWNLVFIEYERNPDMSLTKLDKRHVDTGMGLERLCKVLQNVPNNYDTDLFTPLFKYIAQETKLTEYSGKFGSGAQLDVAYRILADHSRAVSIALADGMFPDNNHKLRRLLRRCLQISDEVFKQPGCTLISGLVSTVTEILGETYPELQVNHTRTINIIRDESKIWETAKNLAASEMKGLMKDRPELRGLPENIPGLSAALSELKNKTKIDGQTGFKMYDTHGLDVKLISDVSERLKIPLDYEAMQRCIENQQETSRKPMNQLESELLKLNIARTVDKDKYACLDLQGVKVEVIFDETDVPSEVAQHECQVVLDRTCFYAEEGGQGADIGCLRTDGDTNVIVTDVRKLGDYIVHKGQVTSGVLHRDDVVHLRVDPEHRLGSMQHHTATHLLNSALHQLFPQTYQRSSHVTDKYLTFDFAHNKKLSSSDIKSIEKVVNNAIKCKINVERNEMSLDNLPNNVITIPGECYPENISVIKISNLSMEPCCGTHCYNTGDLIDFCIVAEKSAGVGTRSIRALAGKGAAEAKTLVVEIAAKMTQLQTELQRWLQEGTSSFVENLEFVRESLKQDLPMLEKKSLMERLEEVEKKVTAKHRKDAKALMERQMKHVLSANTSTFIVHVLYHSNPEPVPLAKANDLCLPNCASLIFACDPDRAIRARATVPQSLASDQFNAETWMGPVLNTFKWTGAAPKGQNPRLVFAMKEKRVANNEDLQSLLENAVRTAHNFATQFMNK